MPFWKRSNADPEAAIRAEYRAVREQARHAPLLVDRARFQNQAGDLALQLRDEVGAMEAWGEALDLFLRDHHHHAARAVARKLLRVRPKTLRVRSTLAWLAIAQDLPADARVSLDMYVTALRDDGQKEQAVQHLVAMSGATPDRDLRAVIADHLRSLDADQAADAIVARLDAEAAGEMEPISDEELRARWEDALAKLVSPADDEQK